ncbi:RNA polymerase sigma factor [Actinophytocola sp. NPDC049390]|uniref:RNA polymerase sigma factor n=1 Tax=Actinophytocola sp. NPDC049390 TaxID=3363894 RepID=UPI00379D2E61
MTAGQTAADLSAAVRAARGGDEAAFRLLYREVQPGLLRYLRGLVGGEDAEDLASETWLQIARDIRTFRDDGAGGFRGWAATIGRHRALDHIRRMQRRPAPGLSAEVLVDLPDRNDTAEQAITHAATNATVELIATLPKDQAEAVLLRVVMGLDAQAVAAVMGKRPGAVRTAVWRGLRKLGERLEEMPGREVAATGVTRTGGSTPRKTS